MICHVCGKEIEGEITKLCGLDVHPVCSQFVIWYENKSFKDCRKCCNEDVYLRPTFINGYLKGIGKCKCGKIYVTGRFPTNPNPRKIKMPKPPRYGR